MIKTKKVKIGDETITLALDEDESTKAKKVYKGKNSKGEIIKRVELDMQPKNKNAK